MSDLQTFSNFLSKSLISRNFRRPSFKSFPPFLMFQPFQTLQVQLHKQLFYIVRSQNFTLYTILFYAFPLFQFKIYNYNCTIPILQLLHFTTAQIVISCTLKYALPELERLGMWLEKESLGSK